MCVKHFLVIGLLLAIIVGASAPVLGETIASWKVCGALGCVGGMQTICVVVIFLITGLTLKTDEVKKALRAWPEASYGVLAILIITPLLGLLPRRLSFLPQEFQIGFILFCSMPTTINSGVALVTAGNGNVALALLLTVASNLLGILTVPFFLSLLLDVSNIQVRPNPRLPSLCRQSVTPYVHVYLGLVFLPPIPHPPVRQNDQLAPRHDRRSHPCMQIDAIQLLVNLLLMILLPLAVGKLVRDSSKRVQAFLKRHKQKVSNTSSLFLCLIPWMKLSESNAALRSLSWEAVLGLLACGLLLHVVYLALNYSAAHRLLGSPLSLKKAVVIMASQKTLPMAMTVLAFFPASLGEPGLIAIPCIVSHLTQIFMDAFIAAKWAAATEAAPPRALLRDKGRWRCLKLREPQPEPGRAQVDGKEPVLSVV
jgi:sodium/bile acid cotransporter 7